MLPTWGMLASWCAAALAGGAHLGFSSVAAHALFWALALMLASTALLISSGFFWGRGTADLLIHAGVISLALVVVWGLTLGAASMISPSWYVLVEVISLLLAAVLSLAVMRDRVRGRGDANPRARCPVALVSLWVAIVAFVLGMGLSHSPFTAYDSLSYHLFFPARWIQAHAISIIPTPFSDEAQAYQPSNGELWFMWLMLAFHGDFLARIGQLPFYLFGATTVYALARRLGAAPAHAAYAPTFFLIAPLVVEQAVGANVDLIHAVLFAASLYLGIVAIDRGRRRDWALWGIGIGLFLGTKYLALVYLPLLLAIPLIQALRRSWPTRAIWALPGIATFAGPWYVRNWILGGSPIYPATLTLAGLTVGRGAFTRSAMSLSFLHTTDPRLLFVSTMHAFGTTLFLFLIPAGALVLVAIAKRVQTWPAWLVALSAAGVLLLCWVSVGDNTDSRFVLPAIVTSISLLPLAFWGGGRVNAVVHVFYAAGIAWILLGADAQIHIAVPWFMSDWLFLRGVIDRQFLPHFAALAGGAAILLAGATRRRSFGPMAGGVAGLAGIVLAVGAETWCVPVRCDWLQISSPHLRQNYLSGARWLTDHVRGVNVAYTGINLPYPLSGSHLANVVYYVNIDRHTDWRFHDYARAFFRAVDRGPGSGASSALAVRDFAGQESEPGGGTAMLARPSGVLEPVAPQKGRLDAVRPRFERMHGTREAWIANLQARRVRYVFISTLDPYEIDYVWHNARGFPIEDEWAGADASAFRLVYENPDVRIYEVRMDELASG